MIIPRLLPLLLASSIAAYRLPAGLADGLYHAYRNEYGEEVLDCHGERNTTSPDSLKTRHHPERRDWRKYFETKCGCGIGLPHGQTDAAVQGLKDSFAYPVILLPRVDDAVFYYSGSVVAFVCKGPSETHAKDITELCAAITKECGWYVAGSADYFWSGMVNGQLNDAETPGQMGYMYVGDTVCEHEWSSPLTSCPGAPFTDWRCDNWCG